MYLPLTHVFRIRPLYPPRLPYHITLFLLLPDNCIAKSEIPKDCGSSHCGNVTIKYPFGLKSEPCECGDYKLEMECNNHNRTTFMFVKSKWYVQEISYEHHTIHVMDRYHEKLSKDYCSLPLNPFVTNEAVSVDSNSILNISLKSPSSVMMLLNSTIPMKSSCFIDASRCASGSCHPASSYFYFLDAETPELDFNRSCLSISILQIMLENITGLSTTDVYQKLLLSYELEWSYYVRNGDNDSSFQKMLSELKFSYRSHGPHRSMLPEFISIVLLGFLFSLCC